MKWLNLVIILVLYTTLTFSEQNPIDGPAEEEFNRFLKNITSRYPNWLRAHKFDASPPSPLEVDLSIETENFHLTCKITDEQFHGYADQFHTYYYNASSITALKMVTIIVENKGRIQYQGSYHANGSIDNEIPLNGNGSWIYNSRTGILEVVNFRYDITADGYIDISDENQYVHWVSPYNGTVDEIYFEGLWDTGAAVAYAEVIQENLIATYVNRLQADYTSHPNRELFRQYLMEKFQEKPYEDIIGTPTDSSKSIKTLKK